MLCELHYKQTHKRENKKKSRVLKKGMFFACINREKNLFLNCSFEGKTKCENSSVGRAQPCQGWGREFESRFSL